MVHGAVNKESFDVAPPTLQFFTPCQVHPQIKRPPTVGQHDLLGPPAPSKQPTEDIQSVVRLYFPPFL